MKRIYMILNQCSAGDTDIRATLINSRTTTEFLAVLPRTTTMNRYDNREYYGRMGTLSEEGFGK